MTSQANLTSAFIDLATFDLIEKSYLYEPNTAQSPFVRKIRASSWFSVCPTLLAKSSGTPDFGQQWSVNVSRAGDYLLSCWLRMKLPAVSLSVAKAADLANYKIRWTKNIMHNIIKEAWVTFNDLIAFRLDNFFLDNWFQHTVPGGKRNGYENMIGNSDILTNYTATSGKSIPEAILNLPIPFGFTRHPGCSLPTAALPFNEIRIQFNFRSWDELLILDSTVAGDTQVPVSSDLAAVPQLKECNVWAEYAIVAAEERKIMGSTSRDILVEQVQTTPQVSWNPVTQNMMSSDLRISHAVKALFFEVRNKTYKNQWSNYTAGSPVPSAVASVNFNPDYAVDPILSTSLLYDNTYRLSEMGSDYFSLIQPFYHCNSSIPDKTGYHAYIYSLMLELIDAYGSTNYGKLTNVSIQTKPTDEAKLAAAGGNAAAGAKDSQQYEFVCLAVNHIIIRVAGGSLGFPVV
jgi:hypothetical protein